jgi:transcriptional regulator with XRE-family HTH domain
MDREFAALRKRLGQKLRDRRKAAGFSQEALALEADVDRTYVSQIERGVCNPSLLALHKIAKILKVSVTDLL